MFKILVHTQDRENYGAHDWDGTGECPQYWKFKGGDSIVVGEIALQDVIDLRASGTMEKYVADLIERRGITVSNEAFETYVLDWELMSDDEYFVSYDDEHADMGDRFVAQQEIADRLRWIGSFVDIDGRRGMFYEAS